LTVVVLESSTLVPDLIFVVVALAYLGLGIVWPAIDAARHRRWLWVAAIVVLSPFAGILWFILRRTQRLDAA
jgi:Na+/melibiose symporter-like transporter